MIEENKRVLLGMSGGTDSSVAAMRLLEAGYEGIGGTFRFYELNGSTEYLEDARSLAEHLGIRHITYDAREVFNKQIIEYFVQEYMAGRTPVPCTLCNNYLKWPLLAELADEMGIFYIATGHYVRKVKLEGTYYITSASILKCRIYNDVCHRCRVCGNVENRDAVSAHSHSKATMPAALFPD